MKKGLVTFIMWIAFISVLSGCMNAAMTGASFAYNHTSIQKNITDQLITRRIYQAINHKSDDFKDANIAIATFNHEVLLAGQVPESWQKNKAEEIAKRFANGNEVHNLIAIGSPSSTLTRLSDSWITAKIKTKLLATGEVDATQIKVVTENGTVFLMGLVLPEVAQAAVDVARNTDGVESVVKVFTYLHVDKA